MDALLKFAQQLTTQQFPTYIPIEKRLAYISAEQSITVDTSRRLTIPNSLKMLVEEGFEPLLIIDPASNNPIHDDYSFEFDIEGIRCLNLRYSFAVTQHELFAERVAIARELMKVYRPAGMHAKGDSSLGLVLLTAARQLSIKFSYEINQADKTEIGVFLLNEADYVIVHEPKLVECLASLGIAQDKIKLLVSESTSQRLDLNSKPESYFDVQPLIPHELTFTLSAADITAPFNKGAVAAVVFLDKDNMPIKGPYSGFSSSAKLGPFVYVNQLGCFTLQVMPPINAVHMRVTIQKWNARHDVFVEGEVTLVNKLQRDSTLAPENTADTKADEKPQVEKALSELVVAGILDEFTTECFRHEVKLMSPTPDNWLQLLETEKPDLLFVESCWFGNANSWSGLIYGYTSNGPNRMDDLIKLINYCRRKAIPTVFWAKEDPVHFSRFAPTAKLFDYVFTTDADMIPEYEKLYGIKAQALSFFCQPRVHNPIQSIPRNRRAAFAGSYYSDKQERCENFHTIMDALQNARIETDIYDRCFDRGLAHFAFPAKYANKVIGNLKPEEMWKAYKGYRYTVNLNTVKHSPTMFARRVYESLASGTPVISNYSEGVRTQFGGIVCASDNSDEILAYINKLQDERTYQEIAKLGAREALARHTLADRLEQVCARIGIKVKPHLPLVNFEITAGTDNEVRQAIALFEQQTYLRKRLVVNLENSNELYPYLNRNTKEEIYRVKAEFAKPLEGITVEHRLGNILTTTYLEDAAIATQFSSEDGIDNKGLCA